MRRVRIRTQYRTRSFGGWGGFVGGKIGSRVGSRLGKLLGKKYGRNMANYYLPRLLWKLGGALFPGLPLFSLKKK